MAQTGFTPILTYASGTASNVPLAANLTSSASGAELALNYADGKLYFKNSSGVVTLLASAAGASGDVVGPASATDNALARFDLTTGKLIQNSVAILSDTGALSGLTDISASGNVTLSGGTANGVAYLNGSKVLTTGSALTFDGTNLSVVNASSAAINVQSLQSYLQLRSTGAFNPFINFFSSTSTLEAQIQGVAGGAALVFATGAGATEQMRLTSTGLGIGTSSPGVKLDVSGQGRVTESGTGSGDGGFISNTGSANGNAGLLFQTNSTSRWNLTTQGTNGANLRIYNYTLGSTVATFDSSGNLGIGTSSPGAKLDIIGLASNVGFKLRSGGNTGINILDIADAGGSGQFVLNASGNLGIGTSSPGAKLTVAGEVRSTTVDGFRINDGTELGAFKYSGGLVIDRVAGTSLFLSLAGNNQAILDSSGNLGLGVTPSAWGTLKAIDISTTGGVSGSNGASIVTQNAYFNGTSWIYKASSLTAQKYEQSSGVHRWDIAPSGTAGNVITFTQAMTLDASGNLGIGTSSPVYQTQIYGSGQTTAALTDAGNKGGSLLLNTPTVAAGDGGALLLGAGGSGAKPFAAIKGLLTDGGGNTTGAIAFSTRNATGDTALTERMRLDASGSLGIGTTSPNGRLSVNGISTLGSGFASADTGNTRPVYVRSSDNNSLISFQNSSTSGDGFMVGMAGSEARLQVTNSLPLTFATNNTERMRLDSSGLLTVGNTSPAGSSQITAYGASNGQIAVQNSTNWSRLLQNAGDLYIDNGVGGSAGNIIFRSSSSTTERARIDSSGNLLVQSTSSSVTSDVGHKIRPDAAAPFMGTVGSSTSGGDVTYSLYSTGAAAYRFYVGYNGTISATTTTISAISDIRFKENVRDLDVGLEKIMALKPRLYDWKKGKGADIKNARGFIAQEFEQVFPDLIDEWKDPAPEGEEPYKAVRADLIPVLVKALQEQQAIIEQLKADVAALKGA